MTISEATVRPDKQILQELYLDKRLSCHEIAEVYGVNYSVVRNLACKYGISLRSRSEAMIGHHRVGLNLTPDLLSDLYWKEGLSQEDIADKFGVGRDVIFQRMREWDIPRRPSGTLITNQRQKAKRRIAQAQRKLKIFLAMDFPPEKQFNLTPDYIVGLTDGEGCFSIYIDFDATPPVPCCDFSLSNTFREVVYQLKSYFGFGNVCPGAKRIRCKPIYTYYIHNFKDQLKLAKFFLEYPLSIKQSTFKAWFRTLTLIAEHKHVTEEGLREIIFLKENMNRRS